MAAPFTKQIGSIAQFIYGLGQGRVREALAPFGLDDAEVEQGRQLLTNVLRQREPVAPSTDPTLIQALDTWENNWFPIARLALKARVPTASTWLFRELSQAEGIAVVLSVTTFVRRYRELENGAAGLGDANAAAIAALSARGLTPAKVAEAEAMLAKVGQRVEGPDVVAKGAEQARAAEQALVDWYDEWRGFARHAVKDYRLLLKLGLRKAPRAAAVAEEEEEDEGLAAIVPVPPVTPTAPNKP
jgi:hypothetical protein